MLRDFFGGDPEIDRLATAALGAYLTDIRLGPDFLEFSVRNGNRNIRLLAQATAWRLKFRPKPASPLRRPVAWTATTRFRRRLPRRSDVWMSLA